MNAESRKRYLPQSAQRTETAARIKVTRLALGLTQAQITEATGIAKNAWSNYENGISRPNIEDAIRFSMAFGISLDWIYVGNIATLPFDLANKIRQLTES